MFDLSNIEINFITNHLCAENPSPLYTAEEIEIYKDLLRRAGPNFPQLIKEAFENKQLHY